MKTVIRIESRGLLEDLFKALLLSHRCGFERATTFQDTMTFRTSNYMKRESEREKKLVSYVFFFHSLEVYVECEHIISSMIVFVEFKIQYIIDTSISPTVVSIEFKIQYVINTSFL